MGSEQELTTVDAVDEDADEDDVKKVSMREAPNVAGILDELKQEVWNNMQDGNSGRAENDLRVIEKLGPLQICRGPSRDASRMEETFTYRCSKCNNAAWANKMAIVAIDEDGIGGPRTSKKDASTSGRH